jgi:hypothetical protein
MFFPSSIFPFLMSPSHPSTYPFHCTQNVFWGAANSSAPKILFGILLVMFEINCMKLRMLAACICAGPVIIVSYILVFSDVESKRDGNGF